MKPYLVLGAILALALPLLGQSPQKFKFQAVARDASGQPYTSVNLGVRISLVRDGVSGLIDYAERHVVTTSPLGVFDLEIGGGLPISGTFADADWANHPYYLKVDIDPDGGTNYMNLGTSQLLSVPYAIYAGAAGNGGGGDPTDELQNLIYNPATQTLTLTNGNTVTLNFPTGTDAQHLSLNGTNLSIENGNTIDLSPLMDGVEDADADPMNELQDISFNPATNQLSISGGSTVTLPTGGTDADADPTNEIQVISKTGNTVTLSNGGGSFTDEVNDADSDPTNEIETWATLSGIPPDIADGDDVDDADPNPFNEIQDISFNPATNQLSISGGSTVTLPTGGTDADADPTNEIQVISKTGNTVTLSNGGGSFTDEVNDADSDPTNEIETWATLSGIPPDIADGDDVDDADPNPFNEIQDISFNPATNQLSISGGSTVTLPAGGTDADADPTNEIQVISKTGNTVTLSNGGGSFTDEVNDADSDPTNEIETWATLSGIPPDIADGDDVDDADPNPFNEIQDISFNPATNQLSISGGSTVTLPTGGTDADADPTNEIQVISKTGNTVTLSNGGGSFTDEVNDADSDPTNEIETWATLSGIPPDIADGDDVIDGDASPTNELQALSLSGSTLSLSGGGGNVDLSGLGSVWSQNGNQIYYNTGRVGLGNTNPDEELVVGTNLNSGWAVPAITVGSNSGGGIQVGNPTTKLSIGSGNAFNRGRIIQSDANGYGQGIIEMRTRQLNIGTEPGINTTRTYPVRIVQNTSATGGAFGMLLMNGTNNDSNWEFYVGGSGNLLLYADNAPRGQFDAVSGNYTATSDARLKTGIRDLPAVLAKVQQLAPKTYQYRGQEGKDYIGLLAQELQVIFPGLVSETPSRNTEEDPTLLVDYNQLSVIALKALQEQQAIIDRQQEQIQSLEARLERLEKQVLKD
ncbi:tail fiber domain-containing protein [Phaeodactylibacter xiamenensis]|uniref:tail fiber domain-containing protein n=1 Tax=Phaeodactylibacter xiamenensis TaxID=1524460 RepID=UPI003CCC3D16